MKHWTDWYKVIVAVADLYFPEMGKIEEEVEKLLPILGSIPEFKEAYLRWLYYDYPEQQ